MQKTFGVLLTVFGLIGLAACNSGQSASNKNATGIRVGMTQTELTAIHPGLVQDAANTDRYLFPERLYGVEGRWTYYFKDDRLKWYVFNSIQQRVDRNSFTDYLRASNEIIQAYDQTIGQPKRVRQGLQEFRDPAQRAHNGYMVQQANWEQAGSKYALDYSFLGEHHSYSLMLSIQVTE